MGTHPLKRAVVMALVGGLLAFVAPVRIDFCVNLPPSLGKSLLFLSAVLMARPDL